MSAQTPLTLEEVVCALYAAIDDALREAGMVAVNGKLIARPGGPPKVDDREVLCLALLQEILGFESDHEFQLWLGVHPIMRSLFPRRLSRQNFADRRALLTPLMQRLCQALCELNGEGRPLFAWSIPIPSTSAAPYARAAKTGSAGSLKTDTALR